MDKNTLLSELDASSQQLLQHLSFFSADDFNQKLSDLEWSAAQIAEHLLLLEMVAIKVIAGKTIPTNRPPDQKCGVIKGSMEDMGTKYKAPEVIWPSSEPKDPQTMIAQFQVQRDQLKKMIAATDITEACMSFKHTSLGTLTRLEWVYFAIYHTQRHLQQMLRLTKEGRHNSSAPSFSEEGGHQNTDSVY